MAGDSLKKLSEAPLVAGFVSGEADRLAYAQDGCIRLVDVSANSPTKSQPIPKENEALTCVGLAGVKRDSGSLSAKGAKKKRRADDGKGKAAQALLVVLGFDNGYVKCYDVENNTFSMGFSAHRSAINDVAVDSQRGLVYTGGQDGYLKRWSLQDMISFSNPDEGLSPLKQWRINGDPIYRVLLQPGTEKIVVGQYQIILWDTESDAAVHAYAGHLNGVSRLMPVGGSSFLSLGENDSTAYVWDICEPTPHGIVMLNEPIMGASIVDERIFLQGPSHVYEYSLREKSKKNVLRLQRTMPGVRGVVMQHHGQLVALLADRLEPVSGTAPIDSKPALAPKAESPRAEPLTAEPSGQSALEHKSAPEEPQTKRKKKAKGVMATNAVMLEPVPRTETAKASETKDDASTADPSLAMTSLMSQALMTNDPLLLEQAFSVLDKERIGPTIEALESKFVPALLEALKQRLVDAPSRVRDLQHWLLPLVHGRAADIRADAAALRQVHELLQLCAMQGALLPKALVLQRAEQLRQLDDHKQLGELGASRHAIRNILHYDEASDRCTVVPYAVPDAASA